MRLMEVHKELHKPDGHAHLRKNFLRDLAKSALLKIMRFIEPHCHYYLARSNKFYPLVNPIVGIRTSQPSKLDPREVWAFGLNKIQIGMTQLMSHEVYEHNIQGAVAELGVFRGFNASALNLFFPDRELYLFDTFAGWDLSDLEADEKLGYETRHYLPFTDTNIELVMAKMPHKENVIVRKGWFPGSAFGLEDETFCYVFLDANLYQPTYEGLHWFYPRLTKGGYIVVDLFNYPDYPGAKKAVLDFSKEVGVSYVPIPDTTGSVVIGKPATS
jgi:O-methyltransferase